MPSLTETGFGMTLFRSAPNEAKKPHRFGWPWVTTTPRPAASRVALSGMALLLVAMSSFAIWESNATNRALTEVSRLSSLKDAANAAALSLQTEESMIRLYLISPTPDVKVSIAAESAEVDRQIGIFRAGGDAPDVVLADELIQLHQSYVQVSAHALEAVDLGDPAQAKIVHLGTDPIFEDVEAQLANTSSHELEEAQAAFTSLHELQDFLRAVTAPAFGACMLLLLGLALVVVTYQRQANKRAEEAQFQALHDPLTGLPNRALFKDRGELALAAAARRRESGAVLLLDLDRFKDVNDTLGHDHGDALLQEVAARLKMAIRSSDTVARLGGDEFTILLPQVADLDAAMAVASKVSSTLRQPFLVGGVTLDVEASIGVAVFPEHGEDIDTLVSRADVAMFTSKRDHSEIAIYSAELDSNTPQTLSLLGELRRALDNGDLVLHYQPKADVVTSAVVGVEALVRWQHATMGMIPPAEFVPLAERTGLIYPLTEFVLTEALRECRTWLDAGQELPVAVNISARNLVDSQFPALVSTLLRRSGLPARMLHLEITENAMMGDPERARASLVALRQLGVSLSLDDFGTGYSSLAYLKDLPVSELKIDRSFVMDLFAHPANRMIVNSVVRLGQNLGLRVVAEGVEDVAVWEELSRLGCDFAQGYFLARPMPGADIPAWRTAWMLEHPTPVVEQAS
jgi:diguanylate cyclase (GGDEF)-like protein